MPGIHAEVFVCVCVCMCAHVHAGVRACGVLVHACVCVAVAVAAAAAKGGMIRSKQVLVHANGICAGMCAGLRPNKEVIAIAMLLGI